MCLNSNFNLKFSFLSTEYSGRIPLKLHSQNNSLWLATTVKNSKIFTNIIVLDAEEHNLTHDVNYPLEYLTHLHSKIKNHSSYLHDIIFSIANYIEFLGNHSIPFRYQTIVAIGNVPSLDNAFWNGQYFVFGAGIYPHKSLCSPAIVGHEMTHALIQSTVDLDYFSESGALNESYADIFGVVFEDYIRSRFSIGFELGTECNFYLRSMSHPESFSLPLCNTSKHFIVDPAVDNCGVHTNSSVINYLFYQMQLTLGLHRTFGYFIDVLFRLNKYSDFKDFKLKFLNTVRSPLIIKLLDEAIISL